MKYLLALALILLNVPLAAQSPIGREVSINQTRAGRQMRPDVGAAADGSFVVVWEDEAMGRGWARCYGANGKPRGGELRVSRLGDRQQHAPAVAVRPDGSFVVVWNRVPGGGKRIEVYASRFTAAGQAVGKPRLVAYAGQASAEEPAAVALLPDGGFFVAWSLEDGLTYWEDGEFPSRDLYGRRFTSDGILVGGRVTLNADPSGDQRHPKCAASRGRELVCTWTSQLGEGYFGETMFRRFELTGLPLGDELQVNEEETTGWAQRYPSIAVHEDGSVLVAWLDSSAAERILGRVLDASGQFLAPSFSFGTTESGSVAPTKAAATEEGFAVVWATRTELLLRRLRVAGTFVGGAQTVNLRRDGSTGQPAVAYGPGGGAVAWAFATQGFHDGDIAARRLR